MKTRTTTLATRALLAICCAALAAEETRGAFADSSLDAGHTGTKSEGWIYLLYEGGGGQVARFNLSWVLAGEQTGNGKVPESIVENAQ